MLRKLIHMIKEYNPYKIKYTDVKMKIIPAGEKLVFQRASITENNCRENCVREA